MCSYQGHGRDFKAHAHKPANTTRNAPSTRSPGHQSVCAENLTLDGDNSSFRGRADGGHRQAPPAACQDRGPCGQRLSHPSRLGVEFKCPDYLYYACTWSLLFDYIAIILPVLYLNRSGQAYSKYTVTVTRAATRRAARSPWVAADRQAWASTLPVPWAQSIGEKMPGVPSGKTRSSTPTSPAEAMSSRSLSGPPAWTAATRDRPSQTSQAAGAYSPVPEGGSQESADLLQENDKPPLRSQASCRHASAYMCHALSGRDTVVQVEQRLCLLGRCHTGSPSRGA
ncbi:hypothetical protein MC885_003484 [Smutsia gigantea]|nr:hypothetical protein MC885_003484 [Smutsia gigantea]